LNDPLTAVRENIVGEFDRMLDRAIGGYSEGDVNPIQDSIVVVVDVVA